MPGRARGMVPREVLTLQRSYASPALPRCVSVALCPPGKGPEAPLPLDRGPAHSASEPLRGAERDTEMDKAWRGAFPSKTFRTPGGAVGDGWTHWRRPTGTPAPGPALSGLPCCSSLVGGLLWDGPQLIPVSRAKPGCVRRLGVRKSLWKTCTPGLPGPRGTTGGDDS